MTPEKLKKLNEMEEQIKRIDEILDNGVQYFSGRVIRSRGQHNPPPAADIVLPAHVNEQILDVIAEERNRLEKEFRDQ